MIEGLKATLLILGVFFIALGCFGVFRLPDIFCRAHALTKSMTLGITFLLLSVTLELGHDIIFKALVIFIFQYMTIPLAGHILGLLAYKKNVPRWKHRAPDRH